MLPDLAIIGTRGYPSYYGGFETAVRKLAPFLADRGWRVTVYGRRDSVQFDDPARDSRVELRLTGGIETKSLSTLSYGFTSTMHAAIRGHDVVLVMNVANGFWMPLLGARGIPTLVNVDGIEWDRAKWGRLAKWVFRWGARATARFGTQMVYDSQEIASRWKRDFDRDGIFIPYGGDVVGDLPIEGGLHHRRYVLMVARFVPENTFDAFLDAVPTLAETCDVVIVGSSGYGGPLDERVRDLARIERRVHWLGHISDDQRLLSLWQHAGVYFHGHSVGGTNPALVQAMACGAPILARDTVYNREVLGTAGRFTAPDALSIAATVKAMLADVALQEHLSRESRARVAKEYTWDSVCGRYETSLLELVASRRR